MSLDDDADRSRRLLFAPELAAGTIRRADLARSEVREAARSRRVPSAFARAYQRRLLRRGALSYETETVERAMAARRAVLGAGAEGPPRLLVRLAGSADGPAGAAARGAHAALTDAGVPHLVAIPPRPLSDTEAAEIAELRRDGVAFGMEGAGTPLRKLRADDLAAAIDAAERRLGEHAVAPEVLVATERIDATAWDAVARRFTVIAAGADALAWIGFHDTPLFRGEAVWMPSYPPFDGPADAARDGVRSLAERGAALWVPVTVHPDAERADGFAALRAFAAEAAAYATAWPAFLDAVRASR